MSALVKPRIRIMAIVRPGRMNGLKNAINLFGSRRAFAAQLELSGEAVRKWERMRVPAERCRDIVRAVDAIQPGAVTLHDLRPDLWPAPDGASEASA